MYVKLFINAYICFIYNIYVRTIMRNELYAQDGEHSTRE